jgi:hypothetical protein
MKLLIRTTIATVGLLLSVAVGFGLLQLCAAVRPCAAVSVVFVALLPLLIFILPLILRARFGWRVRDLLMGLVPSEILMLIIISKGSGLPLGDPFNWDWFFGLNFILGLPWLAGIAAGSNRLRMTQTNAPI